MRRAPCWGSRLIWGVSPSEVGKVPHGRGDTGADRRRLKYRQTDQTNMLIITEATVKIEKGLYWIRIRDTSDSSCFYIHTHAHQWSSEHPPPLTPVLMSIATTQILTSKYYFLQKRTKVPSEKWLILELRPEKAQSGP